MNDKELRQLVIDELEYEPSIDAADIGVAAENGVVTLSGGVFLNAYLTSACARSLATRGFEVLRHHTVPASDAGLALGQVAVLAHRASARPARRGREQPCA